MGRDRHSGEVLMLTWALCWLIKGGSASEGIGGLLLLFAMLDCVIVFLIACAIRGWPK